MITWIIRGNNIDVCLDFNISNVAATFKQYYDKTESYQIISEEWMTSSIHNAFFILIDTETYQTTDILDRKDFL